MFRVFEGVTADAAWGQLAHAFRNGEGSMQPSRAGEMREILHSAISVTDPRQRWVTSRLPIINIAFAIAEVVWILNGRNDSAFLNYFNNKLPIYAGNGETYHGAYGYRLRSNLGLDQLERAYEVLKVNPSSRQVVLQIWDARIDLPSSSGKEVSPDVPCNVVSILKVRAEKLEWMQIMRSNDVYRGLPYNIVQFTTVQEVLAGWLGVEVGEYNQISNSLHVYSQDLERIKASHPRPFIRNTDSLTYPKQESDGYFRELAQNIECIINPQVAAETLALMVLESELPTPIANMLRVLCAEGARRRREANIVTEIMRDCTNEAYKHSYSEWLVRCNDQGTSSEVRTLEGQGRSSNSQV
jgi:thymidylate synthase